MENKKNKKKSNFPKRWLLGLTATIAFTSLLACKESNQNYVKVTFDTGIGNFADSNIIKTLTVKSGTKLCDCKIDKPIFENTIQVASKEMEYWTNDNGEEVPWNYAITNDINLTANYYPLLDIKGMYIGKMLETFDRAYGQRSGEEFEEFASDYIKIAMGYNNSSQVIGSSQIAISTCNAYVLRGNEILLLGKLLIEYLEDITNYKSQVIGSLGALFVTTFAQYNSEYLLKFCVNKIFDPIKEVKLEYAPWTNLFCNFAIQCAAMASNQSVEVQEALSKDTPYFFDSINNSKDSNIAHSIALIGRQFYVSVSSDLSIETITEEFANAQILVEGLL